MRKFFAIVSIVIGSFFVLLALFYLFISIFTFQNIVLGLFSCSIPLLIGGFFIRIGLKRYRGESAHIYSNRNLEGSQGFADKFTSVDTSFGHDLPPRTQPAIQEFKDDD